MRESGFQVNTERTGLRFFQITGYCHVNELPLTNLMKRLVAGALRSRVARGTNLLGDPNAGTHRKHARPGFTASSTGKDANSRRKSAPNFIRSRSGGGMLVGGALALMAMASVGSLMSNYAWREAQWEEVRAAVRAAISSAAPLLSGAGNAQSNLEIAERVAAFAQGGMPGLKVSAHDVTVTHDTATGITKIALAGTYIFTDLWNLGDNATSGNTGKRSKVLHRVKLDFDRYEVAVALDLSHSMTEKIRSGTSNVQIAKIDGLKSAMQSVVDAMQAASSTTPGSLLVSVVPFVSAVNVADTATNGPPAANGRTAAKERYVRMLAGAPGQGKTIGDTLSTARSAAANGWGHWVDSFHQYGVGNDLGPLRKLSLPKKLLDNTDWNLRKDMTLDVSDQVPKLGTWNVNGADFWNGCLMARWGAYWSEDARPAGWSPTRTANWPATKTVAGWSAGSTALAATTPLHLSDAPPDAGDPNSLFTAYSWPDARIGGNADHRLQTVMATLVEAPAQPFVYVSTSPTTTKTIALKDSITVADNDWSMPGSGGGATFCPSAPITPLTESLSDVRQAVNQLKTSCLFPRCSPSYATATVGATYLHLGVVWGMRTLSPLWQRVWQIRDLQGTVRPGVPCALGEADSRCDSNLKKSIVIVSDGANFPGYVTGSRLRSPHFVFQGGKFVKRNPEWAAKDPVCDKAKDSLEKYHSVSAKARRSDFNSQFDAYLNKGKFGGSRMADVLDAFRILDPLSDTAARRGLREAVLEKLTPWQLFRGLDASVTDELMNQDNEFGFQRRPMQTGHFCAPNSIFGPYGRINDRVYVGDSTTTPAKPLPPVADVAPFNMVAAPSNADNNRLTYYLYNRLNDWFLQSCRIAGKRGVRINAIYIGKRSHSHAINALERCVDAAGGNSGSTDVLVTPDATSLKAAFHKLFVVRRNLRFLSEQ